MATMAKRVASMTEAARTPVDQPQRDAALDPQRSFIVQAPAGSGKTALLTQRFLRLLATVEQPEEIVAITFTRKAAAEMRGRILKALESARGSEPKEAWERGTWRLARSALQHADERGWRLGENPQRLRVRTIDSLCQYLARQMPLRSGFGEPPGVDEQAEALYRAAAQSVLGELEGGDELAEALAVLLQELDNNLDTLQRLIVGMLERRDQWLRHVLVADRREEIERALRSVVESQLRALREAIPAASAQQLAWLACYAAGNRDAGHPLAPWLELEALPTANAANLPAWLGLADLLLTQKGEWRKSVTVREGFPPGSGVAGEAKQAMLDLLETLRPDAELAALLHGLRGLPDPGYADPEWALLQALFQVLLAAVAHLRVIFRERGRVDFAEIALAAQEALGPEGEPTDLALRLDYAIRHLLVDEFQDTSQSQHDLLRGLTAGWQPGDGRSLFLVGDPMQSIYRFRKAEVGLFLDAWDGRLGDVVLEPLQLSVNFRSAAGVIDWVNQQFANVFPATGDKRLGAVPYVPSVPFESALEGPAVAVHAFVGRDDAAEAECVLELIRDAAMRHPKGKTAVLVRGRSHLDALIQQLRGSGLRYQAVEIGALAQRPAVLDLLALTSALLHPADRVSWLALLHGPLCGLTLADLHALTGDDRASHYRTLPDLLHDEGRVALMSLDGRARLAGIRSVLDAAAEDRGRRPLRGWIEGTWLALGGPATVTNDSDAEDTEVYLRLLQELESSDRPLTLEALREGVDGLFALPDPHASESLQLMTIHKAKGLEFDTVILPGLGKGVRGDGRRLLYWQETPAEGGRSELFFGPVKSLRTSTEPRTSAWIRALERDKDRLEGARLLYVAATRAKQRLHLLGHVTEKRDRDLSVNTGSLLAALWPGVEEHWRAAQQGMEQAASNAAAERAPLAARPQPPRYRLPSGWICPAPPMTVGLAEPGTVEAVDGPVYEWAGEAARAVGTVVHRWLQRWVPPPDGGPAAVPGFVGITRRLLQREGIAEAGLGAAARRVREALERTLADERGRWLLSADHAESRNELPLTAVTDGQLRHLVIDRSFVDADGTRWIVDYKTGRHEGGDLQHFLDEEAERYRPQLAAYAAAFRALEDRRLRTALYYPLVEGGWREVQIEG